jgi:hypothetical protein
VYQIICASSRLPPATVFSAGSRSAKGGEGRVREMKRGRVRGMGRAGPTGFADADLHPIRPASIGYDHVFHRILLTPTESMCGRLCTHLHAGEEGTPVVLVASMPEREIEARPWSSSPLRRLRAYGEGAPRHVELPCHASTQIRPPILDAGKGGVLVVLLASMLESESEARALLNRALRGSGGRETNMSSRIEGER